MNCGKTQHAIKLMRKGWLTALQSAQRGGPLALSQRIGELERSGYLFDRKWVVNARSKVLAYKIISEPKQ